MSTLPASDPQLSTSSSPPPRSFITGTWYVTYSTLSMWKDRRNVRITYTPLPPSDPSPSSVTTEDPIPRLDDLVEHQALTSDKIKTVHGIDSPSGTDTSGWNWRGKGWLKVASCHWEFVDWGQGAGAEEEWAVIWFEKTIFTPEGIDIFARGKEGLKEETVREIKEKLGGGRYKTISEGLFEVKRD